LKRKVGTGR